MKKSAVLYIFIWTAALVLLPALLDNLLWRSDNSPYEVKNIFTSPGDWRLWYIWTALLVMGAWILVKNDSRIYKKQKLEKKSLTRYIWGLALLTAIISFSYVHSIGAAVSGDKYFALSLDDLPALAFFTLPIIALWAFWIWYFKKLSKNKGAFWQKSREVILRTSLLGLLISLIAHVMHWRRNECCAPMLTYWGIVLSLSAAMIVIGPALWIMARDRINTRNSKNK